jgi:hypothetical protein
VSAGPLAPVRHRVLDPGLISTSTQVLHSAGPVLAFFADEAANGVDLNGDADLADRVPQVYDGRTATLTTLPWSVHPASSVYVWPGEELCAFLVEGATARVFHLPSAQHVDLGFLTSAGDTVMNNSHRGPREVAFGATHASGVGVSCYDASNGVLHSFPAGSFFQALGRRFLHADSNLLREFDLDTQTESVLGTFHAFEAAERLGLLWKWEWLLATDLNGDGDTEDVVTWVRDEVAGTLVDTQLAITFSTACRTSTTRRPRPSPASRSRRPRCRTSTAGSSPS